MAGSGTAGQAWRGVARYGTARQGKEVAVRETMAPPKIWFFNGEVLAERYYQPGMSERKLAAIYGCSRWTIAQALTAFGISKRPSGGSYLEGRWSRKWDRCVVCGTTEQPHGGLGMCVRDYTLFRWRREHPGRPQYRQVDFSEYLN